jgi:hypothetical protein
MDQSNEMDEDSLVSGLDAIANHSFHDMHSCAGVNPSESLQLQAARTTSQ